MDSSWIELPNDHPDYLDGTVKFIKLAKENLIEGRTRCLYKRCKVDNWLPIEEVEQHILFKGDTLDHVKYRGSTSREINIDPPNFISGDDMEGLLRAAFRVDIPRSKDDILHDVVDEPLAERVEYIDVSTPEGELRKALASGLNPVAKSPSSTTTGPNQPCQPLSLVGTSQVNPSTTGLNLPCQPPSLVGTSQVNHSTRSVPLDNQSRSATVKVARGAIQQEVHQKIGSTSQASRESPSNDNNEDLARSSQSQSINKGKGDVGGKQKKSSISKSIRSSRSSWKDNI
ncbi:hypothetical protein Cgig2_022098 [Carnegiea gigantea]|uniref:Uncharacterized protein n=1 Tax=Carnegiea gigantea TaxID=171969 RepID=A0A9Q1JHS1_9CARY|nr:hypothetical protein Cgig2_022098 [Carnegiea gigantea]